MNDRTKVILRYLFVALSGIFLHFAYELSGENPIVGLFAAVNESVWEHLKLLFFPMLVLTLWDLFINYRNNSNFLPARTIGILAGLVFIVVAFYTITGIIGTPIAWINIVIFLLAVALAFLVERKLLCRKCLFSATTAIVILIVLIVLFVVFTIAPPALGIFIPPAV